jgi:probable phosphoglycerate mutase
MSASPEAITRVILIRHGQTADTVDQRLSGRRETPLTPLGEAQAEHAAAQLARTYQLDALYTSPVGRARQTAAIIGEAVGRSPDPDPRLAEMHFGQIEGLTDLELKIRHPEIFSAAEDRRDLKFRWPGGESRLEFRARAQSVFEEIVTRHPGQTVGIVSHGGVISVILQNVAADQSLFWRGYLVGTCHMVEVEVAEAGARRRFRLLEGSCFLDVPQFESPPPDADPGVVRMATMSEPVNPPGGDASTPPPNPTPPEASPPAVEGAYNPPPKVDWRDRPQRDMPKRPLDQWLSDFEQRVQESDARRALEAERAREREASERGRQQARRGGGREAPSPGRGVRSGPPDPTRRRRRRGRGGGGQGQPAAGSQPGAATGPGAPSGPAPTGPASSGGPPPLPGRRPGRSRGRRRRPPHSPQGPSPRNKPSQ